ncbi:seminal metalloprotease 1 [Drosophila biarmipes]|uniref:seminal metalloprotease 1 n=1 Tax=Drosophila biarmipes TaxID=125945 RepID=UPI0007E77DE4|nr:seminal metalloprotease 1 [Drosophila biarmipes]
MLPLVFALVLLSDKMVFSKPFMDPELLPQYFQGDIIGEPFRARNGMTNEIYHWPNGIVYYIIEKNHFADSHYREILRAISIIEANSCIVFTPATEKERFKAVIIKSNGLGCNSLYLGFRNRPSAVNLQIYPIGEGCFRIGSIIHELLHVLGFEHQHVAQSRDQYVNIQWDNISPEYNINFVNNDKTSKWDDFGEGYDYNSLMHYLPTAFSKNGQPTIVALKEGAANMGQRFYMSEKDIRKLNKMYKCAAKDTSIEDNFLI